jgi:hypothetical protein
MKTFSEFTRQITEANLPAEPGDLIDSLLDIQAELIKVEAAASSIMTHLKAASGDKGNKFSAVFNKIEKLVDETGDTIKEIREEITAGVLALDTAKEKVSDDEEMKQAKLQQVKAGPAAAPKPKPIKPTKQE